VKSGRDNGVELHHPTAFWIGVALLIAGVLLHLPEFFSMKGMDYSMANMPMSAMMLIGMALLKNGILKAAKSSRFYLVMGVIGYGVGLITNYLESDYIMTHEFSILSFYWTEITYDLGRVSTTLGHISLIMLFIKSGVLKFLQKALAAVGQMALTNYIMQTIICNTIFLGPGFGMYGKLQRYELYYIVFGIWVLQLIISPLWLSSFRFGPLEWVWRSLTYWEKQPFRKTKPIEPLVPGPGILAIEKV